MACAVLAACASAQGIQEGEQCEHIREGTPVVQVEAVPTVEEYATALADLSIDAVLRDIIALLTTDQACWPADTYSNSRIGRSYGGLFIRLAWHCSGSYRNTDELGGCAGGEMRFQPEAAWRDNTNLDKARALLYPIKDTYGAALSWGDLIVLAGTASILHMGGPVTEVCVGRIDNPDGSRSINLGGPGTNVTCDDDGNCSEPFGANSVGLIYVDAEGFRGEPIPANSAPEIRKVFARMDMNDTETVALIGGGHAFGKSHGACTDGAGPGPADQVSGAAYNPWPGMCGNGRGENTFTSGIEGYWTNDPLVWDNEYYQFLRDYNYTNATGPGGAQQWSTPSMGLPLMMQTTDLALVADAAYLPIVTEFANNIDSLNVAFASAWAKLTTRGGTMSAAMKCISPEFPQDLTYMAEALGGTAPVTTSSATSSAGPDSTNPNDEADSASGLAVSAVVAVAVSAVSMLALH